MCGERGREEGGQVKLSVVSRVVMGGGGGSLIRVSNIFRKWIEVSASPHRHLNDERVPKIDLFLQKISRKESPRLITEEIL